MADDASFQASTDFQAAFDADSDVLTGAAQGPFDIYTFWGLALVIAFYTFPLVFVFVSSSLDLIASEVEDAAAAGARVPGCSRPTDRVRGADRRG